MNTSAAPARAASLAPGPVVGEIEAFLRAMLAELQPEATRAGPGRPRVLPALALWGGLLVCVLHGFTSQLELWRRLNAVALWSYPRFGLSDQAIYKRLAAGGVEPLMGLFTRISAVLAQRLAPYAATDLVPWATEVVAVDHTTLDRIARRLPALREVPAGDRRLLPGRLAGLFDLRRQQWRTVRFLADARQNEKATARDLLVGLPAGSLLLCDLGFFGFRWFDDLTDAGYFYVSRLRERTSSETRHTFYRRGDTFDGIIWLGKHRADRAKHAVRLVCFRHGGVLHRYITNVVDPRPLRLADIARLYARRWDFELAANLIKRHLKLHLLWSAKEVVVQQQVWAVLIISQILQAFRLEIAHRAGADPFEVSMDLLVRWFPRLVQAGEDPLTVFVERGRAARFIRPSTRTVIDAPDVPPEDLTPAPPDLDLQRIPRYAQRNCGPQAATTTTHHAN